MNSAFIRTTHTQLIELIKVREVTEVNQAVLSGALLGEYLIKKALAAKSPIAPYKLDYLGSAHSDFATLITGDGELSSKLRYENIGILLSRSKALKSINHDAIDLIAKIKDVRNGIMHDPDYTYDIWEAHARLLELFAKHSELFKEHLSLTTAADDVSNLSGVLSYIERKIANRLENKITRSRTYFFGLSKPEKTAALDLGIEETGAEDSLIEEMLCPACKNKRLHYLFSVDVDWNPDGVLYHSSTWFECTACGLTMSEYDFDDLYDNPQQFIESQEPDPTWLEYYDYKDAQENAYEYYDHG
jgi:hypothetical protein